MPWKPFQVKYFVNRELAQKMYRPSSHTSKDLMVPPTASKYWQSWFSGLIKPGLEELRVVGRDEGLSLRRMSHLIFYCLREYRDKTVGLKLQGSRFRLDIRRNFLTVSDVSQWNRLLHDMLRSPLLEVFQKRLDDYLSERHGTDHGGCVKYTLDSLQV